MILKRILYVGAAVILVLVTLLIAGDLILRSEAFHRYLLAMVIEHAEEATGGRVEIGDVTIQLSALRADFYRVALHGTESDANTPLIRADHVRIGLTLVSLWKREIHLSEIVIDHPVINLEVARQGRNNIPQPRNQTPAASSLNIFELAIGHFAVNRGQLDYDDRQTPLDAEIRDLQTEVSFGAIHKEYDGTVSYRDGRIRFGDYSPLQHSLEAQWIATPQGVTFQSLHVASGSSSVTAQATLRDYANPVVQGSFDADVSLSEAAKIMKDDSLPVGRFATKGSFHYAAIPGQPFLASLLVDGRLSSPVISVTLPQANAGFHSVTGEYRLSQGNFEAENVQFDALGGHVTAKLSIQHLAGRPEGSVEGTIHNISLSAANSALSAKPLDGAGIRGRMDGTLQASWRGTMETLQAKADANIAAEKAVGPDSGAAGNVVPVEGAVHLAYNRGANILSMQQTYLKTPHTSVNLSGTLAKRSSIQIQAQSSDLHEVDVLAAAFQRTASARWHAPPAQPHLLGLEGAASFSGQLQETITAPRLTGQLSGDNIRYQQTTVRTLRTELDASPSSIALHQGQLQTASNGSLQFDVVAGLRDWSYEPQNPIALRIVAGNLPAADVERLANLSYPVSGILSANISVQGTRTNPAGQGSLRLSRGSAWGQPIQDLAVQFNGNGSAVHATANLRTPAGAGSAEVTYEPRNQGYDARVSLPRLQVDQLPAVRALNLRITGFVTVSAQGHGTLRSPQLQATITAPKLQIGQQSFDGLTAQANVAGQQATFTAGSSVSGVSFQAKGAVSLNGDYEANAAIDTRTFDLRPILAAINHGSAPGVRGQTELHGTLQGPLKYPERMEAHVEVPKLELSYQSLQLAAASPLQIDYRGGTLTLEHAELKGTGTALQIQAVVPIATDGTVRGSATGTADLQVLQLLNRDIESSGQVKLNITAQGNRDHPEVRGSVSVIDGAFQMPDSPFGAEKVNADLEILRNRVNIKSFTAQSAGGTVTAQGFAVYQPSVQFSIGLSAKNVRVPYPDGVRAVVTSDLNLSGTPDSAVLSGQVLIDHLSFTQSFDLAAFANQFTGPSAPPSAGISRNVKLNVALKSTEEMALSSSKLSVTGSADLYVRGTAADPVLVGRTDLTGGELFFNGRRYQVESGVIQFVNPVHTEAVVNLHVATTVDQFELTMILAGPIDRMRTTYTSDPPLAPVDVINLLLTGHTTEASAQNPTTPESVMAGQLAGEVSSRVGKFVGISALSIDPQMGGTGTNSGARLAIQERVTKNLFFTFATNVTSTQEAAVQVEYQVTRKYSLSASRDQNGSYSLQVKVPKRF